MRNDRVKLARRVENDTVSTGRSTSVDLVRRHDGELVPWPSGRELEPFRVAVFVRVSSYFVSNSRHFRLTDELAALLVRVPGRNGRVNVRLPVADRTALVHAGSALNDGRRGGSEERESGDELPSVEYGRVYTLKPSIWECQWVLLVSWSA